MLQHSLHNPVLLIDGKRVDSFKSANFSQNVNQPDNLSASFSDPDLENMSLMDKKVELYLHEKDNVPLFRGFIRQANPQETNISISAQDGRAYMAGNSMPIIIDEKDNYDGFTVVQFLKEYIDNYINLNEIRLDTSTLHEMDKPVYMTGVRDSKDVFSVIKSKLKKVIDDETDTDRTNDKSVFTYFIDIIHMGENSGITFRKSRVLDGIPDYSFSYNDGLQKVSYTERSPPSFAIGSTTNNDKKSNEQVIFSYGNAPSGIRGLNTSTEVEGSSRGELRENLIPHVLLAQQYTKEISIEVTKGYNIGLSNIINLNTNDDNVDGQYRVTGKSINISQTNMSCTISCNNEPIIMTDYIFS